MIGHPDVNIVLEIGRRAMRAGGESQTARCISDLRKLIHSGEIRPGQRLTELALATRLKASRTPVRAALAQLQHEGILHPLSNGGVGVALFSPEDNLDAIHLRGLLEGMAAGLAAQRITASRTAALEAILAKADALVARPVWCNDTLGRYFDLNEQFHALILEAAESPILTRQIDALNALPLAWNKGRYDEVFDGSQAAGGSFSVSAGHAQHREIYRAIASGDSDRAEAEMCSHSSDLIFHASRARSREADVNVTKP